MEKKGNKKGKRTESGGKKGIQTKCGQTYFVEINGVLEEDTFTSN